MEMKREKLEKLSQLSLAKNTHNNGGAIYLLEDGTILKVLRDCYCYQSEIERNVDFQLKNRIPNTPEVYDKLYIDGTFSGYHREYIPDSLTFRDAIGKITELLPKLKAIRDVYTALKFLHQNGIFLGDIHLDNFLITYSGTGYLIDLDYMRFPKDEYKFEQCYLVQPNDSSYKINVASKYTDNVKVALSCLSLLLGIDLEVFISSKEHSINLEKIYIAS